MTKATVRLPKQPRRRSEMQCYSGIPRPPRNNSRTVPQDNTVTPLLRRSSSELRQPASPNAETRGWRECRMRHDSITASDEANDDVRVSADDVPTTYSIGLTTSRLSHELFKYSIRSMGYFKETCILAYIRDNDKSSSESCITTSLWFLGWTIQQQQE